MTPRLSALGLLVLASCAAPQPVLRSTTAQLPEEIRYVSSDLENAMVFSKGSARAGSIFAYSPGIWPSDPTRDVQTEDNVQCLSMGNEGSSLEFAIRRPIKAGDHYTCLRSAFRVIRCFADCRAAIIEVDTPLGGGAQDTLKSYMYVDACVGVPVFSQVADLAEGIPLSAVWLRGNVGILADPTYPKCNFY
jgi:hypothetical protein